jgi:hypothetical protein
LRILQGDFAEGSAGTCFLPPGPWPGILLAADASVLNREGALAGQAGWLLLPKVITISLPLE